ncbi:Glycinol 4-dimethylallyltransferase, partial [Mucuna pruriens]
MDSVHAIFSNASSLTTGTYMSAFASPITFFFDFIHFSCKRNLLESLVIVGGNIWRSKHSNKNIYYASSCASKTSLQRKTQREYNLSKFQPLNLNHHYKFIEGGSAYQKCNKNYIVKAIPRPSFDSEPVASNSKNILDTVKNFLAAFYWFCYPYAIIGRTLGTISTSLLAVEKLSDISPLFFIGLLQVLVPHFFMDLYINGLNQLYDIEIDKINKPYLPLASGQISFTTGVIIVASSLILVPYKFILFYNIIFYDELNDKMKRYLLFYAPFQSFWLGWIIGSWPLIWSLILCFLLWTVYSINCFGTCQVPLLRWKENPLLAAISIFVTWTFIMPITFFLHMQIKESQNFLIVCSYNNVQTFVLKRSMVIPRSLIFFAIFTSFYSVGVALFKDIPDMEGDKAFGIHSFSARLGQKRVFWICVCCFEMAFGVSLLAGATSSSLWIKIVTGLGHAALASILWYQARNVDLRSKASIGSFYMLIWKLLYAAYFLVPLIR